MQQDPLDAVFDLLADGREVEARTQLDTLIREEPWNGSLRSIRALLRVDQQELDGAAEDAAAGVELAEGHPFAHYCMATVELARGDLALAIGSARRAQEFAPDYADAILLEARAHAADERFTESRDLAARVMELDPENEEAALLHTLTAGAVTGGRLDQASWRALADRFPLNPVARAGAGWTRLSAGQVKDARVEFEQALALDPTLPWAREGLVLALKARNPVYAVLLRFFQWLGRFPKRTRNLFIIGGFIAYQLLRGLQTSYPELRWVILPLLVLYIGFLVLSWLADPLLNLVLMARADGRRLLRPEERQAALLVGGCLGLAGLLAGAAALGGARDLYLSAFGVGLTSFGVAAAYNRSGRRRRQLQAVAAAGFGCGLASGAAPPPADAILLLLCLLCVGIATWTSSLGSDDPEPARP